MPPYAQRMVVTLLAVAIAAVSLTARYAPGICNQQAFQVCGGLTVTAGGIGWVVTVFTALLWLFNAWLWRTVVARWMGWPIPDVHGTWRGDLTPVELPAGTPLPTQPTPIILVIRQQAFRIEATLYTSQSSSRTVTAGFTLTAEGADLAYTYKNTPKTAFLPVSPEHHGTAIFALVSRRPAELSGSYFTGRLSKGDMLLQQHSSKLAQSFDDAVNLSFSARPRLR